MIRAFAKKHTFGLNPHFRYRGEEPGRLENFSDAVFALAITLLLISTSPPTSFDQVKRFVWEIIPFCLSIVLIVMIWHQHFIFFFRYGLRNMTMVVLNTAFVILMLFYVYPLKFLTRLILIPIGMLFGEEALTSEMKGMIRPEDVADLMVIYGFGAASIFLILALMYRYALRQAEPLGLNAVEIFETKVSLQFLLLMGAVPLLSVVLAWMFYGRGIAGMIAGFSYFLYTPLMIWFGAQVDRRRAAVLAAEAAETSEEDSEAKDFTA